jgi:uncharacterized protein (TIGR02594 family)
MSELTLSPEFAIPSTATCPWMDYAMQEMGTREKSGARSNPEVVKYLASCDGRFGGDLDDDRTDWCSAFVNWCLAQASIVGTNHTRARSWIRWGLGFRVTEPRFGAIAVFTRTRDHSLRPRGKGHVAFVWRKIGAEIYVLGGNQNNRVRIKPYPANNLLVYMWPSQTFTLQPRGPLSPGYLTPPSQIF